MTMRATTGVMIRHTITGSTEPRLTRVEVWEFGEPDHQHDIHLDFADTAGEYRVSAKLTRADALEIIDNLLTTVERIAERSS